MSTINVGDGTAPSTIDVTSASPSVQPKKYRSCAWIIRLAVCARHNLQRGMHVLSGDSVYQIVHLKHECFHFRSIQKVGHEHGEQSVAACAHLSHVRVCELREGGETLCVQPYCSRARACVFARARTHLIAIHSSNTRQLRHP